MTIINCDFHAINTATSIIVDILLQVANVYIANVNVDVISGSIYYSKHLLEANINIYNISITSNQSNSKNKVGLLYFESADVTNITNMTIFYKYNTTSSCHYSYNMSNSVIDATCDVFVCQNPVMAVQNNGKVYKTFL